MTEFRVQLREAYEQISYSWQKRKATICPSVPRVWERVPKLRLQALDLVNATDLNIQYYCPRVTKYLI